MARPDDAGDSDPSTLWGISAFEREREREAAFPVHGRPTLLPTTLLADLRRLEQDPGNNDVLEVVAACVRHREAARLSLQYEDLAWPVTLFPTQQLYHSPRDLAEASEEGLSRLVLLAADPPGVKPPGHWRHERVGVESHYRPLPPLLWQLALHGPRRTLLAEIGGRAAYRLAAGVGPLPAHGALGPALKRLKSESVSLAEMAGWPGLSVERASRLLNALYLTQHLLVTRSAGAARRPPGWRSWIGR